MANVKKGLLTPPGKWWKHLRWVKRVFWKRERKAAKEIHSLRIKVKIQRSASLLRYAPCGSKSVTVSRVTFSAQGRATRSAEWRPKTVPPGKSWRRDASPAD
jgi:hypothetical protein